MTAAEQLLARGREEGREEGRLEGERTVLLRLLGHRFTLAPADRERVAHASPTELAVWTDRVLEATSLAEVFGPIEEPAGPGARRGPSGSRRARR